jgi:hypothetical protein
LFEKWVRNGCAGCIRKGAHDGTHLLCVRACGLHSILSTLEARGCDHFHGLCNLLDIFGDPDSGADLSH